MEFVSIVLVLSLFYASADGGDVSSGLLRELVLTHDYPLILQENFNFVRLTCRSEVTSSSSCDGITFLLNGTNIRETPLNVSNCTKGSISIKLSQDSEGEFVCSYNSTLLSNNVTLAAKPGIVFEGSRRFYTVFLESVASNSTIELECGMKPGVLRQRYGVAWYQIYPTRKHLARVNEEYSLTVDVTVAANGSRYQCEVTVNHNGSLLRTYTNSYISLSVHVLGNSISGDSRSRTEEIVLLSFFLPLMATFITTFLCVGICLCYRYTSRVFPTLNISKLMTFTLNSVMISEQTYNKATRQDLDVAILTQDLEAEVLSSITVVNNIDQDMSTQAESTNNCDEQCIEGATSIMCTTHNDEVVPLDLNRIKSCGNTGTTEVEILQEKNGSSDTHPLQRNDFYSNFRMYGFDNLTETASHTKSGNNGLTRNEDSLGYQNSITPTEKQDEDSNDKLAASVIETHTSKETHSSMVSPSDDAALQDLPRGSTETGSAKVDGMMTRHWSVRDIRKPLQKQVRRRATSGEPAIIPGRKGKGSNREENGSFTTLPRWQPPEEDMETDQRVVGRSTSERCGKHTLPRSGRRPTVPRAVQPPSLEHHVSLITLTTDKLTWSQL